MVLFILIAAGLAFYFGAKALHGPRPAVIAAAVLWLLYAVYEWQVASRFDCDGPCNIRVDLALILPILLIASFFAIRAPGPSTRASSQSAPAGKGFRMGGLAIGALMAAILAFVFLI